MKMDPKLVASKQRAEVAYVAKKMKVTQKIARKIMLEIGGNGKPCRSRRKIESAIKIYKATAL